MNTYTYHLDQNLRGKVSKGFLAKKFLDKYQGAPVKEAILPLALLEYAGIEGIKKIIREITIPQSLLDKNTIECVAIKEHWENELKSKLPEKCIKEKLKERHQRDNNYAESFAQECINILPDIYNMLIAYLSWDRFSKMEWSDHISDKNLLQKIRLDIGKLISKENLPVLRHCANHLLNERGFTIPDSKNPDINTLVEIIKKTKIKYNADMGDCEFIHTAINGQPSADHKQRAIVDCYTMDPVKEIKRRLIFCFFFYETLEYGFQYQFNPEYCGRIYIIDEKGNEKEKIEVTDYYPINKILQRIKAQELETLFLLND